MGRSLGSFSKPLNEVLVPRMNRLLMIRKLSIASESMLKAGLLGSNEAGLYKPVK